MPIQTHRRTTYALMALCAVLFLVAMSTSGVALYTRFKQTNAARAYQASLNSKLAKVSLVDCFEIEKLKTAQRQAAIEDYKKLSQTLKLLKIESTPAIRATALKDERETLRRFASQPCPRVPLHVPAPKK